MEAATPLRQTRVTVLANRVIVDGLLVEDPAAVELIRARAETGEDPARVVGDAIEIGARVLDREQTGANAEYVRTEFEKVSREVESAFADKARVVADFFGKKVDEVFHEESGHLSRSLERHFSDGSSAAVQHRVKDVVADVMAKSREDLVRQFSSADGANPLAQFQRMVLASMSEGAKRQDENLRSLLEKLAALEGQVVRLQDDKRSQLEVAAEVERGTAKGRTFEEAVFEVLDRIALAQGDDCDAVGDSKGTTRRTGDIVVALEACRGPARGRVVFEAKTAKLGKRAAVEELDRAREERNADYAVLVVSTEEKVPARMQTLREYNGDKLVVCFDPEDGSTLALEVAYSLARARVLMARGEAEGVDGAAVREAVERALGALAEVQRIKQQLTGATTSIEKAREIVDAMAAQVRGQLAQVESLLDAAEIGEAGAALAPAAPVAQLPAPRRRAAPAEAPGEMRLEV